MKTNNLISRRNFITKSTIGAGVLSMSSIDSFGENSEEKKSTNIEQNVSPREILIQSVSNMKYDPDNYKNNIMHIIKKLEITSSYKPDIICLPENFSNSQESPQKVPGTITNAFSSYANEHNCYIICTLITKRNNKKYNTAVLIDRKGDIVGMYDKIHPTEGECDKGIIPGNLTPQVFKTDFGTIGIQICFDINWLDEWRKLKELGAEIVFWSSTYPNPTLLSSYASLFKYYVVGCSRIDPCYVYDMTGNLISMSGRYEGWAFAYLNLEKIHCEIDYHVKKVEEIRKKYGRKVRVVYYHDNDWVTIESRSPNLKIKQIIDEFGLTSHWDYIKRAEKYQNKFRQK